MGQRTGNWEGSQRPRSSSPKEPLCRPPSPRSPSPTLLRPTAWAAADGGLDTNPGRAAAPAARDNSLTEGLRSSRSQPFCGSGLRARGRTGTPSSTSQPSSVTSRRSSKRTPPISRSHRPGSTAITSPATSGSRPDWPSPGSSCTSRPTPCPSENWKPSAGSSPGPVRCVRWPAASNRSQHSACSSRPVTPGPAAARALSSASATSASWARTAAGGSPITNVRVMSAQQPEASSCGHRSIWIGRPAGSGPWPDS